MGLEQGQQLIVKDLYLPHGAMAGVDLHRAVVCWHRGGGEVPAVAIAQIQNIGLQAMQQAVLAGLDEPLLLDSLGLLDLIDKVAALLAQ